MLSPIRRVRTNMGGFRSDKCPALGYILVWNELYQNKFNNLNKFCLHSEIDSLRRL